MGCSNTKSVVESTPAQPSSVHSQPKAANMYVALYDYKARTDDELSIKARDHLEIIDDTTYVIATQLYF